MNGAPRSLGNAELPMQLLLRFWLEVVLYVDVAAGVLLWQWCEVVYSLESSQGALVECWVSAGSGYLAVGEAAVAVYAKGYPDSATVCSTVESLCVPSLCYFLGQASDIVGESLAEGSVGDVDAGCSKLRLGAGHRYANA